MTVKKNVDRSKLTDRSLSKNEVIHLFTALGGGAVGLQTHKDCELHCIIVKYAHVLEGRRSFQVWKNMKITYIAE